MTTTADVIVIGAGAHGAATAWHLARRGRHVVVLERFEQGHRNGSSHGGSRIFRFAYDDPRYVRLAQEALPLWRELEDDAGTTLLETTGGVDHGSPEAVDAIEAALAACGAVSERLAPADVAERWPGMRADRAALVSPDSGRALADRTVRALQDRAAAHGADVRFGEAVEAIAPPTVRTNVDEYRAPVVVVAAGAWTAKLLDGLVDLPPLTVTREQVFHFGGMDGCPSFIHHTRPWRYGLETPGQGVKVAEHHTGAMVDPDTRTFEVDPDGCRRVIEYVEEWFPGLEPEPMHAETCLYTTTPTEDFFVERTGPIVTVSACSGHGFKFTPVIGRLAADLATGG